MVLHGPSYDEEVARAERKSKLRRSAGLPAIDAVMIISEGGRAQR